MKDSIELFESLMNSGGFEIIVLMVFFGGEIVDDSTSHGLNQIPDDLPLVVLHWIIKW